jgi:hypothetical protein
MVGNEIRGWQYIIELEATHSVWHTFIKPPLSLDSSISSPKTKPSFCFVAAAKSFNFSTKSMGGELLALFPIHEQCRVAYLREGRGEN